MWIASVKWSCIDCVIQRFRPVGRCWGCQSSRVCGFTVLVCRPKSSLLISNSPVKFAAGTRWCVLFGAVNAAQTAGWTKTNKKKQRWKLIQLVSPKLDWIQKLDYFHDRIYGPWCLPPPSHIHPLQRIFYTQDISSVELTYLFQPSGLITPLSSF